VLPNNPGIGLKIPLFPLSSIVLPGGKLPLRLFEPRYIRMVSLCMKEEIGFGVCLAQSSGENSDTLLPYPIGTLTKIVDFDQGEDGLLQITAVGVQEFRLAGYEQEADKLLIGEVELQDRPDRFAMPMEFSSLAVKLSQILDHLEPHISFPDRDLDDAEWVCNRLLELLPIDAGEKFEMLNSFDTVSRLQALDDLSFSIAED